MRGCVFVSDGVETSGGVALMLLLLLFWVLGMRGSGGSSGAIARTAHA